MSDGQLRDLERASAAGDARATGRLLRERVRAATLSHEQLRLAAYLGHEVAREVAGEAAPEVPEPLEAWLRGLEAWSREATVRAAIAIGRAVLPLWERSVGWQVLGDQDGRLQPTPLGATHFTIALEQALAPRRMVEAAEGWVLCPCPAHATAAEESSWGATTGPGAACCLAVARSMTTPDFAVQALIDGQEVFPGPEGEATLRGLIQAALIPWALDRDDPLQTEPRLARPDPHPQEWVHRGWAVRWEDPEGELRLCVDLDGEELSESAACGPEDRERARAALVEALDARLWEARRWIPPRPDGRGYTRTLRVKPDQAAPQAQGTKAR